MVYLIYSLALFLLSLFYNKGIANYKSNHLAIFYFVFYIEIRKRFEKPLKFLDVGVAYIKLKDKRALMKLPLEMQRAFCRELGIDME